MLNICIIAGRLVRDPEIREVSNGSKVCNFTLAVDRDANRDVTDFIDCVAWNANAEFVNKWFSKGQGAIVNGNLQFRDWEDKNGNKRRNAEVVVNHIYFNGNKANGTSALADLKNSPFADISDESGDLPF